MPRGIFIYNFFTLWLPKTLFYPRTIKYAGPNTALFVSVRETICKKMRLFTVYLSNPPKVYTALTESLAGFRLVFLSGRKYNVVYRQRNLMGRKKEFIMRSWFRNHPVCFMAGYLVFYLAFFFLLEKTVLVPDLILHCTLDDLIPFCKYAIIPYYLWFLWIPGTLFFLLFRAPRWDFWRLCLPLFIGMTLALLFCAVVPSGVYLRPGYVPGTDVFAEAVRDLYRADTSTNVFPSIHVLNAVTLDLAWQRYLRRGVPFRIPLCCAAHLLDFAIIASTMLLKQHSAMDAMGGVLLALLLDRVGNRLTQWWFEPHSDRRKILERV